ncbi:SRPBCC domain-containing protein [Mucilaginibacter paludis]|uniref:Activator of Hsp90 ATPase homologue 1/2-like C-terminal domain-containing protein n=1 Tax=Mucilaginibacter paludis DSM 18603 TaxID=714943 RepID=H1Y356_9SPHI|nr:SRPBCC domain-containing protein [Mucilaginibacter paludis]EHQ28874.1 hypothetical protein Mucpa_4789 [Mucilaginibacter paludis DSM 18603]
MKTTTTTDFTTTIMVDRTVREAFDAISDVSGWWAKDFKGRAKILNDVFTVTFGQTFVDFKIAEVVPGEKVVWLVTDCNLHWLKDHKEWKNTSVVWEIAPVGSATEITMTHVGLAPACECYDDCNVGWTRHINGSLYKLLSEGVGQPQ